MKFRDLGKTGLNVSVLSLGGAQFGQQFQPVPLSQAAECVHAAIDRGVNLIDTSAYYGKGKSEEVLGEVLQGGWRQKVALCTKAGRLDRDLFDFTPAGMRTCLEGSLRRLRTDYVDILIAHDIEYADNYEFVFTETVRVLHDLKREGKCRFVGMSGLPLGLLKQAIERCQLDVIISYCQFCLLNTRMAVDLLPVADQHGVGVINASPLSMGLLTNQGPPDWHPAPAEIQEACRSASELCRARGADISFLGMQYVFAEGRMATTLTGAGRMNELETNLRAMTEPIDSQLLKDVLAMLAPVKDRIWPSGNWTN